MSFDQNLLKRLENVTQLKKIKDKNILKIILREIWVKLCWLWFNFLNTFKIQLLWAFDETLQNFIGNMGETVLFVLSFDQNLLETITKFNIDWIVCDFDKD